MTIPSNPLETMLAHILALRPAGTVDVQRFSVEMYRLLALGQPVDPAQLGRILDVSADAVLRRLADWPALVQRDPEGRVTGWGGLGLEPTPHRFEVAGRTLYTWCAWDALFIPEILGRSARVVSRCPQTGAIVQLELSPGGIPHASPPGLVVTFPPVDPRALRADVLGSFCCEVHFFSSADAGRAWAATRPGVVLVSVEEAWQLGRRKNAEQFNLAGLPIA